MREPGRPAEFERAASGYDPAVNAARLVDIGILTCSRCNEHVAVLRAEVPSLGRSRSATLFWAHETRTCACSETHLPSTTTLPVSVRRRLREVSAASEGLQPWQQPAVPSPMHLVL